MAGEEQARLLVFLLVLGLVVYMVLRVKRGEPAAGGTQPEAKAYGNETAPPQTNYHYINRVSNHRAGAPQLVEVFGTHCPPCKAQVPHIARLAQENPNVHVVSVSTAPEVEIATFIQENPQAKRMNVASDAGHEVAALMRRLGLNGVPHCFVFNGDGRLTWHGHPAQVDYLVRKLNRDAAQGWGNAGKGRKL